MQSALKESLKVIDFHFDDTSTALRRNLLMFSTIALAASALSPVGDSQSFEINAILVKGEIDNPRLVYGFIFFVCAYYLIHFCVYCRALILKQYDEISSCYAVCATDIF